MGISNMSERPHVFSEVANEWLPCPVEVLPVYAVGIQFHLGCIAGKLVNVARLGGGLSVLMLDLMEAIESVHCYSQPVEKTQARCVGGVSALLSQWAASWYDADLAMLAVHAVCTHSLQFWVILNLLWQLFLVHLILGNECNIFLQNTGNNSPVTAHHPRRLESPGTVILTTFS
jgi:hypothetical protein